MTSTITPRLLPLVSVFSRFAAAPDVRYYQGPGWYRGTLQIAPHKDGRTLLRLDGAGQKTKVYVEDTFIGWHVGAYDEFQFDITDAIRKHADDNGMARRMVRCDNSRDLQMIPSDLSDFNLYGGLHRPVHLLYRPAVGVSWPTVAQGFPSERAAEIPWSAFVAMACRPGSFCSSNFTSAPDIFSWNITNPQPRTNP